MVDDVKMSQLPCTDCTLLYATGGLEYPDGRVANTDTGAWLHHIVGFNTGPGRSAAACHSMPMDPFWSSGNERETKVYTSTNGAIKSGYYIKPTDKFMLYSELMNMDPVEKHVYITGDFEYLPGRQKDYMDTKAIWLQLGQCGEDIQDLTKAGIPGKPLNNKAFTEASPPWTSQYDGQMLYVSGHLHDGGTHLEVIENGKTLCDSQMKYGETPAFHGPATELMGPMVHISSISNCTDMGKISKGDKFHIKANYDFTKHPGMKNSKGELDEIMGIAEMYIAVPQEN
jgi:hypothetical protein